MGILLTNDDGVDAPGLFALWETLSRIDRVMVAAPRFEQSGVGHALSLSAPVPVRPLKAMKGWAIKGSPADCVRICVKALTREPIDIVVSGINFGPNVGISVLYSGTGCGAIEGAILGIPSMAFSMGTYANPKFSTGAAIAKKFAKKFISRGRRERGCPLPDFYDGRAGL